MSMKQLNNTAEFSVLENRLSNSSYEGETRPCYNKPIEDSIQTESSQTSFSSIQTIDNVIERHEI